MVGTIEAVGTVKGWAATVCTVSTRPSVTAIGAASRSQPFNTLVQPLICPLRRSSHRCLVVGMHRVGCKAGTGGGILFVARRLGQHVIDIAADLVGDEGIRRTRRRAPYVIGQRLVDTAILVDQQ